MAAYIIKCRFGSSIVHIEQDEGDYTSRRDVVRGIISGEIRGLPYEIIEVIGDEQVVENITASVAEQVRDHFVDGVPERLVDFVESNTPGLVRAA